MCSCMRQVELCRPQYMGPAKTGSIVCVCVEIVDSKAQVLEVQLIAEHKQFETYCASEGDRQLKTRMARSQPRAWHN